MRLGLLLSEIGQANGVEVNQQEMNQLIMQAAQQYRPEDRAAVRRICPQRADGRRPSCARRCSRTRSSTSCSARPRSASATVTREELEAAIEAEDGHVHGPGCGHDHGHAQAGEEGRGEEARRQEGRRPRPTAGEEAARRRRRPRSPPRRQASRRPKPKALGRRSLPKKGLTTGAKGAGMAGVEIRAAPHRRPASLLQRGSGDRADGRRLPRRAARRGDLRLRQQQHATAPARSRPRPARSSAPSGCRARAMSSAACSPTSRPTSM